MAGWPSRRRGVVERLPGDHHHPRPELSNRHPHLLGLESDYWTDGTNWIGRLLELIRSQLVATRADILDVVMSTTGRRSPDRGLVEEIGD